MVPVEDSTGPIARTHFLKAIGLVPKRAQADDEHIVFEKIGSDDPSANKVRPGPSSDPAACVGLRAGTTTLRPGPPGCPFTRLLRKGSRILEAHEVYSTARALTGASLTLGTRARAASGTGRPGFA